MNAFREIQPTQAIIPVKRTQESVERKQNKQKKQNLKKEEHDEKEDDHKVDEFI